MSAYDTAVNLATSRHLLLEAEICRSLASVALALITRAIHHIETAEMLLVDGTADDCRKATDAIKAAEDDVVRALATRRALNDPACPELSLAKGALSAALYGSPHSAPIQRAAAKEHLHEAAFQISQGLPR